MKVYNVEFDMATPISKSVKVPANTSRYGLGVAVKKNGQSIDGLQTRVLDSGSVVDVYQKSGEYDVFALSSGAEEHDHRVSISAFTSPMLTSTSFDGAGYISGDDTLLGQKRSFTIPAGEFSVGSFNGFVEQLNGVTTDLLAHSQTIYQSFVNAIASGDKSYLSDALYEGRFSSFFAFKLSGDVALRNTYIIVDKGSIKIVDMATATSQQPSDPAGYTDVYTASFMGTTHTWVEILDKIESASALKASVVLGESIAPLSSGAETTVQLVSGQQSSAEFSLVLDETTQVFPAGEIADSKVECETFFVNGVNYVPTTLSVDGVAYSVLAAKTAEG